MGMAREDEIGVGPVRPALGFVDHVDGEIVSIGDVARRIGETCPSVVKSDEKELSSIQIEFSIFIPQDVDSVFFQFVYELLAESDIRIFICEHTHIVAFDRCICILCYFEHLDLAVNPVDS